MSLLNEYPSIHALGTALREKKFSARELAQDALNNVTAHAHLNAFIDINAELTLQQADAADALLANQQGGPLTGIPIAHKDVLVTKGWRSTAGSKMLENYRSPFDATVVERLNAAGTVSLGKLNCDEFAMGSDNQSSFFGAVHNPWNTQYSPGGSSGGSAAAVAANLVLCATGTDTGGSIRQPAALCGVSGIKPTYGTVSRFGMIAYGSSLDQAGPIARNAKDLLEVLSVMSGFDPHDPTSLEHCLNTKNTGDRIRNDFNSWETRFTENTNQPLASLRIGIPKEYFENELDSTLANQIESAIAHFEKLGATRVDVSLPLTREAVSAYYVITPAEASSNLSRFDGVRFGHRAANYSNLEEMISRSRAEGFGDEVIRRILVGTYVLSEGYYDAYYLQAQRVRRMIVNDFQQAFAACDFIMGPVTPSLALPLGERSSDPTTDWLSDIYTLGVSLAGLPAMSVPCGFTHDAQPLPIGLQLIGNYFSEGQLLALADRYQQDTDWHQRKPEAK
ncbi:MAG TPA: Asp-tRNA(Asn)/Glu-tRNA(Gln) amidotransferase subunit GatA [Paenalcaligenes sp.]|nr:Asp-tRNA(Asn)/Glu-tRNA(Gln) amidotransferase subunit GatA [Paenalcaligenes sp.]